MRWSRIVVFCLLSLAGGLLIGCVEQRQAVRITSNDFTEQRLLAEMMMLMAENRGVRARHTPAYGNNRKNLEALKRGVVDAYPEYSGTLLALTGLPPQTVSGNNPEAARAVVEPLGLSFLEPFGLDNAFTVVVRRDLAIEFGLETISDLDQVPGELRFAADEGYLERSVDGLYALARRYGLEIGSVNVLPVRERRALFRALSDRSVDVAVVFQTDPLLEGYGIVNLVDDLGFFADYKPAPLVRTEVLNTNPRLREAWTALAGLIDTQVMRELNRRVELGGEDYRDVARQFLESLELLPASGVRRAQRQQRTLAINPLSDGGYLPILAADAIRQTQPAVRLVVERHAAAAEAVISGQARFGLVGAEEFFRLDEQGEARLVSGIEAVGVVGNRLAHLIAKSDAPTPASWRRLGTGPAGGPSSQVASLVLRAMGLHERIEQIPLDDFEIIESALLSGRVDAVVLMTELRQAGLMNLLQSPDLQLVGVKAFRGASPALRYPFLHPARIPAGTYEGQEEMLESVSSQVVLAARVPADPHRLGEAGPGVIPEVFTRLPQRLPPNTARSLNRALGNPEAVDPVLPASPGLSPDTPELRQQVYAEPYSAILNVLALLFLVAMAVLYFRKLPAQAELSDRDTPTQ